MLSKPKKRIVYAGRGKEGENAVIILDTGEEILVQEAIRQIKLGKIETDYSFSAKVKPPPVSI